MARGDHSVERKHSGWAGETCRRGVLYGLTLVAAMFHGRGGAGHGT
jgi:hypothetical protein